MNRVHIYNLSNVMRAVKGTNDKIYYIPPKSPKPLPKGVEVKEGLNRYLRVTHKAD